MRLPDFIIIGAAKCGTTSLYHYLNQHPEIYMSPRGEPSFFAHEGQQLDFKGPGDDEWNFITDISDYKLLFADAPIRAAIGEVSPRYLFFEQSHRRIAHYIPEARLVVILRHPVDRAYSHFLMNRRRGCEPESDFRRAIQKEIERAKRGWGWDWRYIGAGLYSEQLQRYYRAFSREQIKVFLYHELKETPGRLFQELFHFLEVGDSFKPNMSTQHRSAFAPHSYLLQALLRNTGPFMSIANRLLPPRILKGFKKVITTLNATQPETLSKEAKQELFERYFEDDCAKLESMIKRDLSGWKSQTPEYRCAKMR